MFYIIQASFLGWSFGRITQGIGDFSAAILFFGMMCIGAFFLIISFIFGHDSDTGDGGFDLHHDIDHGGGHGPSAFSLRTIMFFIAGFGAFGFMFEVATKNPIVSSIAGMVGGVLLASSGYFFIKFFYSQQATSLITTDDIVGATGHVTTTIPAGGIGEVALNVKGKLITKTARSIDGSEVKGGAHIEVIDVTGETVTVKQLT